jgi:hypothetical protein
MRHEGLQAPVGSAGTALGYLFIPFFSVWWAPRFYGLGRYLNAVIEARDLDIPYAAEDLGEYLVLFILLQCLCMAVAACLPPVLFGVFLFALAGTATWIFLSHNLQRSVNAVGRVLGGV